MRRVSPDPRRDLALAAAPGDQLALPSFDSPLPYCVRRSLRESICVRVEDGVAEVSAPRGATLQAIEAAVRNRCASALPAPIHLPPLPRVWGEGTRFPFLGRSMTLQLTVAAGNRHTGTLLEIALPPAASPAQIRDAAHGWLQTQARKVIEQFAACKTHFPRWALSFSRSTLTAVDADGCLRLNWRLVLLSRETIAQVLHHACVRDIEECVQTKLLSE